MISSKTSLHCLLRNRFTIRLFFSKLSGSFTDRKIYIPSDEIISFSDFDTWLRLVFCHLVKSFDGIRNIRSLADYKQINLISRNSRISRYINTSVTSDPEVEILYRFTFQLIVYFLGLNFYGSDGYIFHYIRTSVKQRFLHFQ